MVYIHRHDFARLLAKRSARVNRPGVTGKVYHIARAHARARPLEGVAQGETTASPLCLLGSSAYFRHLVQGRRYPINLSTIQNLYSVQKSLLQATASSQSSILIRNMPPMYDTKLMLFLDGGTYVYILGRWIPLEGCVVY